MNLRTLLLNELPNFLCHLEWSADIPARVAKLRQECLDDLEAARKELADWTALTLEEQRAQYDHKPLRPYRERSAADLDATEAALNMAPWPDQLLYLRAAMLGTIGVRRMFKASEGLAQAPRWRLPFNVWLQRQTTWRQSGVAEAEAELAAFDREVEADMALLSYVTDFLADCVRAGLVPENDQTDDED